MTPWHFTSFCHVVPRLPFGLFASPRLVDESLSQCTRGSRWSCGFFDGCFFVAELTDVSPGLLPMDTIPVSFSRKSAAQLGEDQESEPAATDVRNLLKLWSHVLTALKSRWLWHPTCVQLAQLPDYHQQCVQLGDCICAFRDFPNHMSPWNGVSSHLSLDVFILTIQSVNVYNSVNLIHIIFWYFLSMARNSGNTRTTLASSVFRCFLPFLRPKRVNRGFCPFVVLDRDSQVPLPGLLVECRGRGHLHGAGVVVRFGSVDPSSGRSGSGDSVSFGML